MTKLQKWTIQISDFMVFKRGCGQRKVGMAMKAQLVGSLHDGNVIS
jgi:hypothetical protein